MPIISIDDLKRAVVGNRIGAITIDTSVYEKYKFGFEVGHLARMDQFSRMNIEHLIVDMVRHEVLSHLLIMARDDKAHVRNALKPLQNSWGIGIETRTEVMDKLFGILDEAERSEERLKSFEAATGATLIKCVDYAELPRVVDLYFSKEAPFANKEAKKYEFPDALSLLALESWACKHEKLILVVAKDGDWRMFCETSDRLCYVDELPQALSVFHAGAEVALDLLYKAIADGVVEDLVQDIFEGINNQTDKIDIGIEACSQFSFDPELMDIHVSPSDMPIVEQLANLEIIDYRDNILLVQAIINGNVSAQFMVSFQYWDGIDKEYMGMGSSEINGMTAADLTVLLTFRFNDGEILLEHVELIETDMTMDFGEIEPDWMSDPNPDLYGEH